MRRVYVLDFRPAPAVESPSVQSLRVQPKVPNQRCPTKGANHIFLQPKVPTTFFKIVHRTTQMTSRSNQRCNCLRKVLPEKGANHFCANHFFQNLHQPKATKGANHFWMRQRKVPTTFGCGQHLSLHARHKQRLPQSTTTPSSPPHVLLVNTNTAEWLAIAAK